MPSLKFTLEEWTSGCRFWGSPAIAEAGAGPEETALLGQPGHVAQGYLESIQNTLALPLSAAALCALMHAGKRVVLVREGAWREVIMYGGASEDEVEEENYPFTA